MSEQFSDSYPEIEAIQFNRFDINIHDPNGYVSYINSSTMPEFIAHGYEEYPIHKSSAWFELLPENEEIKLHALIECDALRVKDGNWKQTTLDALAERLNTRGLKVKLADHDTDCLYVYHPDDYRAFGIRGGNTLDRSYLEIESLPQPLLHGELGTLVKNHLNQNPALETIELENFLSIWGTVQDFLAEHFNPEENMPLHARREQIFVGKPTVVESQPLGLAPDIHHTSELTEYDPVNPLDTVGGMFEAKHTLKRYVKRFQNSELASELQVPVPAFILQGPPGTGKTTLMEAFAKQAGAKFRQVSSSEIQNEYIGKTSRNIESIFDNAFAEKGPIVLCFDEIDRYLKSDNHREFVNAAKTFGTKLEEAAQYPHVLIAAAMNSSPDQILSSTIRPGRMKVIEIHEPNESELADIWRVQLAQNLQLHYTHPITGERAFLFQPAPQYMDDEDSESQYDAVLFGERSSGMTGADISQVLAMVREAAFDNILENGTVGQISPQDILTALDHYRRNDFRPNTD